MSKRRSVNLPLDELNLIEQLGYDIVRRVLWLTGDVDEAMHHKVWRAFYFMELQGHEDITIFLATGGGTDYAMFGVFDIIKNSPCKVTIIGSGQVSSAGCVILQAGDTRLLMKHTTFMHHAGSTSREDDSLQNFYAYAEWTKKLHVTTDKIMLEQIQKLHKNFPMSSWRRRDAFDTYLTADEAVGWGLADGIWEGN